MPSNKNRSSKKAVSRKAVEVEELEDDYDETIVDIAEFSEEEDVDEDDLYLDDDAEEKLDEYLEGMPAVIIRRDDNQQPQISEDYPTENHAYCRVKASRTHREVAPEFNNTLIIREKK